MSTRLVKQILVGSLAVILQLIVAIPLARGQAAPTEMCPMGIGCGMGAAGMVVAIVFLAALIAVLVALAIFLIRRSTHRPT